MTTLSSLLILFFLAGVFSRPPGMKPPGFPFPPGPKMGKFPEKPFMLAPIIVEDEEDQISGFTPENLLSLLNINQSPVQATAATTPQVIMVPQVIQAPCPQTVTQPTGTIFPGSRSGIPTPDIPTTPITPPAAIPNLNDMLKNLQDEQQKKLDQLQQQNTLERLQLITQASDKMMTSAMEQAQKNQQLLTQLANQPVQVPTVQVPDTQVPVDQLFPGTRSVIPNGQLPTAQLPMAQIPQQGVTMQNPALMSLLGQQPLTTTQQINFSNLLTPSQPIKKKSKISIEKKLQNILNSLTYSGPYANYY
ncbi:hypothetical protein Ciccas_013603 [Cichlidogyrus casuarinus]|uniref:Uncharacterized protein n=1 Tax=Cichlidogyrus casuarinus TaxID=1844966 RepID=A0ABD2PMH4_9PLAT